MEYKLVIEKRVVKNLEKYDNDTKTRIISALKNLPFEGDVKKLQGYGIPPCYRLRVGNHRVIFKIDHDNALIHIIDEGLRGDVY